MKERRFKSEVISCNALIYNILGVLPFFWLTDLRLKQFLTTSTIVETNETSHVLEGIVLVGSDGRILKEYQIAQLPKVELDFSTLGASGYLYLLIKTNRGLAIKKIVKY